MPKSQADERSYLYLILSCVIVMFSSFLIADFGLLFPVIFVTSAIALFIILFETLIFTRTNPAPPKKRRAHAPCCILIMTALLVAIFCFQLTFLLTRGYNPSNVSYLTAPYIQYLLLTAIILPTLLLGMMLVKRFGKKLLFLAIILIAVSITVTLLIYNVAIPGVRLNDADYLGFLAAKEILSGKNPYAINNLPSLAAVFQNGTINSVTLTTTNAFEGTLIYPPLYPIFDIPLALISGTFSNYTKYGFTIGESAMALLLMAVIAYFGRDAKNKRVLGVVLVVPFILFALVTSINTLLFAVLIFAYFVPDRWYFGVALGIGACMQQLAWPPVIMLLGYSFLKSGYKKGFGNLAIMLLTILIISSYFLFLSPATYVRAIFLNNLNGKMFPSPQSPIGFAIARFYPIPLSYLSIIFYLAFAMGLILFLAIGEKRNLGILSLFPFLFLYFTRPEYYLFFLSLSVVIISIEATRPSGQGARVLNRKVATILCAILILAMLMLLFAGHAQYMSAFGLKVSEPSLVSNKFNMSYIALLHKNGSYSGDLGVLLYGFAAYSHAPDAYLAPNTLSISNAQGNIYLVNENLSNSNLLYVGAGPEFAAINLTSNENTIDVYYAQCAVYSEDYLYYCPPAQLNSSDH